MDDVLAVATKNAMELTNFGGYFGRVLLLAGCWTFFILVVVSQLIYSDWCACEGGLKCNPKLAHTERICSFVLRTPEISIRPVIGLVSDCGQRVLNKAIGVLVITRVVSLIQQRLIYDRDHLWPR